MKRCIERKDYLASRDRMYGIYDKWVRGEERTEEDFSEFFRLKEYVTYYEGSRRGRQQRSARKILEKRAD